ncbi:hypothetical protein C9374_002208 [Naegleria lovaniensis]|uniref:Uncharacterized protein n=1 Tax=Naegleria lovaniensis TaxID=51637 RepID=A0AA88GVG8_NAELO|nr:uncharacterized protein C9374_002208 [Naegleria lovaniensis]KAG2386464.1 hypothetical protein C9374_002208 [Naegleria lovaniensis]
MGSNTSSTLPRGNHSHSSDLDTEETTQKLRTSIDSKRHLQHTMIEASDASHTSFKPSARKTQSHSSIVVSSSDSTHHYMTSSNPLLKPKTRPSLSHPSLQVSNTYIHHVPSPLARSSNPITTLTSASHQQQSKCNQMFRMPSPQKGTSPSTYRYVEPTYSPEHSSHLISQYSSRPNVLAALNNHDTASNKFIPENENDSVMSEDDLSTVVSSRRGSVFSTTTSEVFSLPSSQSFLSTRRGSISVNGSSISSGISDDTNATQSNVSSDQHVFPSQHQYHQKNQEQQVNDTSSEENCIILNNKSNKSLVHSSSTNSLSSLTNYAYQPSPIQTLFQKNKLEHSSSEKTIAPRYGSLKSLPGAQHNPIHSKSASGAGFTSLFNPALDKKVIPEIPLLAVTKPNEPPCFSHLPRSVNKRCQQQAHRSGSAIKNRQYLDVQ